MSSASVGQLRVLNNKRDEYFNVINKLDNVQSKSSDDLSAPCSPKTRDEAVTAILKWVEKWKAGIDTSSLAICLLDLTIAKTRPPNRYVHVAALASLHLAAKVFEEDHVESDTDVYNLREVRRMQLAILKLVNWDLSLPTHARYLIALTSLCEPALTDALGIFERATTVLKQALQRHRLVYKFEQSTLALGAFAVAVKHEIGVDNSILYAARLINVSRERLAQVLIALESMLLALSANASGSVTSIMRRVRPGRCARKRRRRINSKGSEAPSSNSYKRLPRHRAKSTCDIFAECDDCEVAFHLLHGDLP